MKDQIKNTASRQKSIPVTWDQVTAFRLARHHLLERASAKKLLQVAGDMAGAQAQLFSAAQLSLWARVRDLRVEHIEKALIERSLVRTACMRRTLFLIPSSELALFVRGTARRAEKEIRWALGKGVPERVIERAIDVTLDAMNQPLTRPEIAERVSRALGVGKQNVHGGGWGSRRKVASVPVGALTYPVVDLLHLVGARGVVCYGPDRDGQPTFVRADVWIPGWQDVPEEQAENELLRRYLRTFGPVTVRDFAWWTGITLTEARAIWARQQAGLTSVDVEGWEGTVLQDDLDELKRTALDHPHVRLIPYFDSFLLGHKDRAHLVTKDRHAEVYRPQGWVAPVLLVDGRVAAVWKHVQEGKRLCLEMTKFGPLSKQITAQIREEAYDLGRFLGFKDVDIQLK
ncbi:MAG: winged helix DNA-binding domain-containing protein [Anaerolineales bacterium]|jgi:hypothetical protein